MAEQKSARGSFPAKLYDLVDSHSRAPEDEVIVTWCENGLAFIVRDLSRFCEEVLPHHFCHNKWASFIRQLNLYGFRRITQGQSSGAYWHKFFQRGEPHLLRGITRSRRQGSGAARKQQQQREPEAPLRDPYERTHDDLGRTRGAAAAASYAASAWGAPTPPMHAGVPLPPVAAVLPTLPPPPIISDEALLSELDDLVQAQRDHHRGLGGSAGDLAAMPPPPARDDGAGAPLAGSGSSLAKFLDRAAEPRPPTVGDGLRKRMASHQSIHSVGSLGQMTEIGGHGPQLKREATGGMGASTFRAGRRVNSKSSLASDDWDLNIADVDSLNLDDWRWSESQGPGLGFGRSPSGDFLRVRSGDGLATVAAISQGLPASEMPRSRSKECVTAILPPPSVTVAARTDVPAPAS